MATSPGPPDPKSGFCLELPEFSWFFGQGHSAGVGVGMLRGAGSILPNFHFMLFDWYWSHMQDFQDFIKRSCIIFGARLFQNKNQHLWFSKFWNLENVIVPKGSHISYIFTKYFGIYNTLELLLIDILHLSLILFYLWPINGLIS